MTISIVVITSTYLNPKTQESNKKTQESNQHDLCRLVYTTLSIQQDLSSSQVILKINIITIICKM